MEASGLSHLEYTKLDNMLVAIHARYLLLLRDKCFAYTLI